MKKKCLGSILLFSLILICACKSNKEEYNDNIDNKPISGHEADSEKMDDINSIDDDSLVNLDTSNYTVIDFNDIDKIYTPTYGNLPFNCNGSSMLSSFGVDIDSGDIFFSNYSDKNYLYMYSNGESKLLAELKCGFINFYNDCLYFIAIDGDIGRYESSGAIYKYDLKTDECAIFIDMAANRLYIENDILYIRTIGEKVQLDDGLFTHPSQIYYVDFSDNKPKKLNYKTYMQYYGYYISTFDNLLINHDKERIIPFDFNESNLMHVNIYEDKIFINRTDGSMEITNLLDSSKNIINLNIDEVNNHINIYNERYIDFMKSTSDSDDNYVRRPPNVNYQECYTYLNDSLYIVYNYGFILKVNVLSGEVMVYYNQEELYLSEIYTDGKDIYCIEGKPYSISKQLVKIKFDELDGVGMFYIDEI